MCVMVLSLVKPLTGAKGGFITTMAYGAGYKRRRLSQGGTKRYAKRRMTKVKTAFKRRLAPLASRGFFAPRSFGRAERKVFDVTTGTIDVLTLGSIVELCIPQLGSDFTQRIGRKILMKSLYLRYMVGVKEAFNMTVGSTIAPGLCRLIVFVDYQPNGAVPTVTDLLAGTSPLAQLNLNNRDRFKILRDITHTFDAFQLLAANASPAWCKTITCNEVYKKINVECIFNATSGGTVADINSGALYTLFISTNPGGGTHYQYSMTSRVRYTDN